jgi:hypothetical protein
VTTWRPKYLDCVIDVNSVIQKSSFRQNFSLGTKRYRKEKRNIVNAFTKKKIGRREAGAGCQGRIYGYIPLNLNRMTFHFSLLFVVVFGGVRNEKKLDPE